MISIGYGIYVKGSDKAVEFYQKVFRLELGYNVKNPDGTYYHSELCMDGKPMMSVVESKSTGEEKLVQLGVEFDSEEEVKTAYELLIEDGKILTPLGPLPWTPCAAEVVDKFGVWWYISACSHRPPDDYDFFTEDK